MSAAPKLAGAAPVRGGAPRAAATPADRHVAPTLARRLAVRIGRGWLPRLAWTLGRTGRVGLAGLALLLAAAVFLVSTHLQLASEVDGLRAELASRRRAPGAPAAAEAPAPAVAATRLPARSEVPELLRQLFETAARSHLAVDTAKVEIGATRGSGLLRHQVAFPVTGSYPQVRAFIDATLSAMPAVALAEVSLARKAIGDGEIEAQLRMTIFTTTAGAGPTPRNRALSTLPRNAPPAGEEGPAPARVVKTAFAGALFAPHSWYVRPPPPPPVRAPPPPPPPEPTAPPFPFRCVGSYAPAGEIPVYFLARGDHVVDAHVGDRIDGVYQFESAGGGQLVFTYLPLGVRQTIPAGTIR